MNLLALLIAVSLSLVKHKLQGGREVVVSLILGSPPVGIQQACDHVYTSFQQRALNTCDLSGVVSMLGTQRGAASVFRGYSLCINK